MIKWINAEFAYITLSCLFLFLFWKLGQDPLYRVGGQGKSNQDACLGTNSDNKQKQLRFDQDMSGVSDEEIQRAGG